MTRSHSFVALMLLSLPCLSMAQAMSNPCSNPIVPGDIHVGKDVWREAADLSPELQKINQMINQRGCTGVGVQALEDYQAKNPDDYKAAFVRARIIWTMDGAFSAENYLIPIAKSHPDFASAQVLLGSIAIHQNNYDGAAMRIQKAKNLAPNDLWLNLNELRLANRNGQGLTKSQVDQLILLLNSREAPGPAREQASVVLREVGSLDDRQTEAILRAQLEFESQTPRSMKVVPLARLISANPARRGEVRELLQASVDGGYFPGIMLLAASYLQEAATISPTPNEKNKPLVEKARKLMSGDLAPLALHLNARDQLDSTLWPLIVEDFKKNPDVVDSTGTNWPMLCHAAFRGDLQALKFAVENGANVNVMCGDDSLVFRAVYAARPVNVDDVRLMVGYLRSHGSEPYLHLGKTCPPATCDAALEALIKEVPNR